MRPPALGKVLANLKVRRKPEPKAELSTRAKGYKVSVNDSET